MTASAKQYRNPWISRDYQRLSAEESNEVLSLLWAIVVILVVLWLLGLVTSYTLGGFIHVLLGIAIVVVLLRIIDGRKPI